MYPVCCCFFTIWSYLVNLNCFEEALLAIASAELILNQGLVVVIYCY